MTKPDDANPNRTQALDEIYGFWTAKRDELARSKLALKDNHELAALIEALATCDRVRIEALAARDAEGESPVLAAGGVGALPPGAPPPDLDDLRVFVDAMQTTRGFLAMMPLLQTMDARWVRVWRFAFLSIALWRQPSIADEELTERGRERRAHFQEEARDARA